MELPHMAQLGREPPASAPTTGATTATDQPHPSEPAMTRHTCTDCHHPIRNGEAVVRSVSFAQVAYHRECWAARYEVKVRAA